MSISISQAISTFKNATTLLQRTRKQDMLIIAKDTLASVKSRVINQGIRADGARFSPYSTKLTKVTNFQNAESRGANDYNNLLKAVTSKKKGVGGFFVSYKHWREANRLQTNHKDFSFTSRMWKSIRPVVVQNNGNGIIVEIKSNTDDEQKKLNDNSKREGISLLALNKIEELNVRAAYKSRVFGRLQEAGF